MQGIQFQENFIQRLPAGLSVEQIIHQLAQPLVTAELVVPDFADHVLEREATYPTGLPTEPPCVAIPHTDHKHVRHNAIAVGILPEPVAPGFFRPRASAVAICLAPRPIRLFFSSILSILSAMVCYLLNPEFLSRSCRASQRQTQR